MQSVEKYLVEFTDKVLTLTRSYLVWKYLNIEISSNIKLKNTLNEHFSTWITIIHSLQVTLYISMGRIFDTDGSSFSINRPLTFCVDNIEKFSSESLINRKLKVGKAK